MTIPALIDKQDTFEVVRDQVAAILTMEVASQMQLAAEAGRDPNSWKLRIFEERSNPWELLLNEQTDRSPIVNVWYDNSSFSNAGSNSSERQASEAVYNIDCYGYGLSRSDGGDGQILGDREAAREAHRALRLIRNILMASEYVYLGLRGLVGRRWPQSITVFQPQLDGQQMQQVVGARIALKVLFNEFSPQVEPTVLELLSVDVIREEGGEIILRSDYDYTAL